MLKVLMPSLNQLINADYKTVKTPETEALIKQSLQGLVPSAQPGIAADFRYSRFRQKHVLCRALAAEFPVSEF